MKISSGHTYHIVEIKKRFDSEDELYEDLKQNDFYGGDYKVRHCKKGIYLTAEVYESAD